MKINRQLSSTVKNSNLTQTEFESILYKLSPQQSRLFTRLADYGEADTMTLRTECSIGNISDVAIRLNKRLKEHNDPRRVKCILTPNTNKFGESGVIGVWFLVPGAANDSAA